MADWRDLTLEDLAYLGTFGAFSGAFGNEIKPGTENDTTVRTIASDTANAVVETATGVSIGMIAVLAVAAYLLLRK